MQTYNEQTVYPGCIGRTVTREMCSCFSLISLIRMSTSPRSCRPMTNSLTEHWAPSLIHQLTQPVCFNKSMVSMSRVDPPAEQIYGLLIVPPSRWRSIWSIAVCFDFRRSINPAVASLFLHTLIASGGGVKIPPATPAYLSFYAT